MFVFLHTASPAARILRWPHSLYRKLFEKAENSAPVIVEVRVMLASHVIGRVARGPGNGQPTGEAGQSEMLISLSLSAGRQIMTTERRWCIIEIWWEKMKKMKENGKEMKILGGWSAVDGISRPTVHFPCVAHSILRYEEYCSPLKACYIFLFLKSGIC